ncbi:hypothetical protein CCH79_00017518, partial [Gambusia affinis]
MSRVIAVGVPSLLLMSSTRLLPSMKAQDYIVPNVVGHPNGVTFALGRHQSSDKAPDNQVCRHTLYPLGCMQLSLGNPTHQVVPVVAHKRMWHTEAIRTLELVAGTVTFEEEISTQGLLKCNIQADNRHPKMVIGPLLSTQSVIRSHLYLLGMHWPSWQVNWSGLQIFILFQVCVLQAHVSVEAPVKNVLTRRMCACVWLVKLMGLKAVKRIDKEFENKPGHISSLLLELREVRRETGSIEASLQIIFETTSDFKEDAVTETMMNLTCESCPLPGTKNLCDSDPCDNSSTTCKPTAGSFTCSCVDGYINTDYSDKLCMACRSGQKAVNNECKPCDFGRTGLNCEDERLLNVVIVSSVLGFLLVVALIALLVVVKKFKRTQFFRTKQEDIRKLFQIPSLAKGPLSSNSNGYYTWFKEPEGSLANSGVPGIPRANSISNWDNLAMTQWINEQNSPFDGNHVDMISFSQIVILVKELGVPTEFIPEGIKLCWLLVGVNSELGLLSQLALSLARGIRGTPEFPGLLADSLTQ